MTTGHKPEEITVEVSISQPVRVYRADRIERLYDAVNWLFLSMTHTAPESKTSREYLSNQVMIASSHTHPTAGHA